MPCSTAPPSRSFNRATAETGSVECAAEYLRRAHANTLVVRTKCSLAAREPRKSLDMYYAAFALIADGEDGSALEPNAIPTSASGAQCATLLQCLCAALAFPPQVFQILRAELFLESTVRVTFEEFVAVMDVCLAVIGASLVLAGRSLSAHTELLRLYTCAPPPPPLYPALAPRARRCPAAATTCMAEPHSHTRTAVHVFALLRVGPRCRHRSRGRTVCAARGASERARRHSATARHDARRAAADHCRVP